MFAIFATNYIDMVKAYTLSDRIVQQGFNDVQSLVGMVFKSGNSGAATPTISSYEVMINAPDFAANVVPQVIAFRYMGNMANNGWYTELESIFTETNLENTIIGNLFEGWGPNRQYIQIRSVSVNVAPDSTSASPLVYMKITADAYTASA